MMDMLNIEEQPMTDESVASYQTYSFLPISGTQLNTAGQIVIRIENSDNFYRPCDSWLQFEGRLTKHDDSNYARADLISIANNGILFLFDNIKYQLSGAEIESLYHPGQAVLMHGLLKNNHSYNSGAGLNACWAMDDGDGTAALTNIGFKRRQNILLNNKPGTTADDNSGCFRFAIRLEDIFGFAFDYRKICYGHVHVLTLIRNINNANAIFKAAACADVGKIEFTQISWHIPRIVPSDVKKYELLKLIKDQTILNVGFRMKQCITTTVPTSTSFFWRLGVRTSPEKPRYLILGFQTGRSTEITNRSAFDHCQLENAYVLMNNDRYPMIDYHANFPKNHYDGFYTEFWQFIEKYYGVNPTVTSTAVDPILFKKLYPIIVFDVKNQSERIQQSVVDITIQCFFGGNVAADTSAYCLMISDRKIKFKSDGNKMSVVF